MTNLMDTIAKGTTNFYKKVQKSFSKAFSYLSEVGARGLLELENVILPIKIGKKQDSDLYVELSNFNHNKPKQTLSLHNP